MVAHVYSYAHISILKYHTAFLASLLFRVFLGLNLYLIDSTRRKAFRMGNFLPTFSYTHSLVLSQTIELQTSYFTVNMLPA